MSAGATFPLHLHSEAEKPQYLLENLVYKLGPGKLELNFGHHSGEDS